MKSASIKYDRVPFVGRYKLLRRVVLAGCVAAGCCVPAISGAAGAPPGAPSGGANDSTAATAKSGPDRAAALKKFQAFLKDGILNNSLGRHGVAEKAFQSALGICEAQFGDQSPDCGDTSMRLALELSNQERFQEAGLQFRRAEILVKKSDSVLDVPRLLTYRAIDAANQRDFPTAMRFAADANQKRKALLKSAFKKARTADPEAKEHLDITLSDLAHGLYVQASIAFQLGRLPEAKVTAFLVRNLIGKTENIPKWWIAFVDALLADIELREGNVEAAEKRLRLALKTKQVALGNTRAVALSYMALGAVFRGAKRDTAALETSRPGLAILRGELRQAPGISLDRLEPFLNASYETATHRPESQKELYAEMFAATQLVRTSRTAQTVTQMAARFASDRPEIGKLVRDLQYQTRWRDELRLTLGQAAMSSARNTDAKQIANLKKSYKRAANAVVRLEKELKSVFPSYADLVSPTPAGAQEVSALLGPDEALVYIISGKQRGYVFVVRKTGISVVALDMSRSELGAAIRKLRQPFEKPGKVVAPFDLDLAHRLYRKLLGPSESALTGIRHLILVSSNELLSLPFSLLVTAPAGVGADRYRKASWLIRKFAITQMPSVRTFTSFRRTVRPSKAPRPFIGFGNPAFKGKATGNGLAALSQHCQLGAAVPSGLIRGLTALPETAGELRRVAKALKSGDDSIHLGAAVTETKVRTLPLDQYRVVYFATHGLLPGELRCQSQPALALSPPDSPSGGRNADGLFEASEIATLKLDADLVVLSACNTGGGGGGKLGGESLSGLARAFFQAGTRSVLVSHWQVDTVATARLMTRMFERVAVKTTHHLAKALQSSQIDLLSAPDTAHPFFWAAFTFVGEGRFNADRNSPTEPRQLGRSAP